MLLEPLSLKQSLLLFEMISEQMEFEEGNKEEGAWWKGSEKLVQRK